MKTNPQNDENALKIGQKYTEKHIRSKRKQIKNQKRLIQKLAKTNKQAAFGVYHSIYESINGHEYTQNDTKFNELQKPENQSEEFIDRDFPPIMDFLTPIKKPTMSYISWYPIHKFYKNREFELFKKFELSGQASRNRGFSYITDALNTLSTQPGLVMRLFDNSEKSEIGLYKAWINLNGQWRDYLVDDNVPVFKFEESGKAMFYFISPNTEKANPEVWAMVLHKALAKAYGGLDSLYLGNEAFLLRDFTGAPVVLMDIAHIDKNQIITDREDQHIELFWRKLNSCLSKGYLLSIVPRLPKPNELQRNEMLEIPNKKFYLGEGIYCLHNYAVVCAHEVVDGAGLKHRLVKLKNPWLKERFEGEWGPYSDRWTPELRRELEYYDGAFSPKNEKIENDGNNSEAGGDAKSANEGALNTQQIQLSPYFWISARDLMYYFEVLNVCKVVPGNVYSSQNLTFPHKNFVRAIVRFTITQKGKYTFSLDQADPRCFFGANLKSSSVKLTLCKLQEDTFQLLAHTSSSTLRNTFIRKLIDRGEYYALIELHCRPENTAQEQNSSLPPNWRDSVFSVYGPHTCGISVVECEEIHIIYDFLLYESWKSYADHRIGKKLTNFNLTFTDGHQGTLDIYLLSIPNMVIYAFKNENEYGVDINTEIVGIKNMEILGPEGKVSFNQHFRIDAGGHDIFILRQVEAPGEAGEGANTRFKMKSVVGSRYSGKYQSPSRQNKVYKFMISDKPMNKGCLLERFNGLRKCNLYNMAGKVVKERKIDEIRGRTKTVFDAPKAEGTDYAASSLADPEFRGSWNSFSSQKMRKGVLNNLGGKEGVNQLEELKKHVYERVVPERDVSRRDGNRKSGLGAGDQKRAHSVINPNSRPKNQQQGVEGELKRPQSGRELSLSGGQGLRSKSANVMDFRSNAAAQAAVSHKDPSESNLGREYAGEVIEEIKSSSNLEESLKKPKNRKRQKLTKNYASYDPAAAELEQRRQQRDQETRGFELTDRPRGEPPKTLRPAYSNFLEYNGPQNALSEEKVHNYHSYLTENTASPGYGLSEDLQSKEGSEPKNPQKGTPDASSLSRLQNKGSTTLKDSRLAFLLSLTKDQLLEVKNSELVNLIHYTGFDAFGSLYGLDDAFMERIYRKLGQDAEFLGKGANFRKPPKQSSSKKAGMRKRLAESRKRLERVGKGVDTSNLSRKSKNSENVEDQDFGEKSPESGLDVTMLSHRERIDRLKSDISAKKRRKMKPVNFYDDSSRSITPNLRMRRGSKDRFPVKLGGLGAEGAQEGPGKGKNLGLKIDKNGAFVMNIQGGDDGSQPKEAINGQEAQKKVEKSQKKSKKRKKQIREFDPKNQKKTISRTSSQGQTSFYLRDDFKTSPKASKMDIKHYFSNLKNRAKKQKTMPERQNAKQNHDNQDTDGHQTGVSLSSFLKRHSYNANSKKRKNSKSGKKQASILPGDFNYEPKFARNSFESVEEARKLSKGSNSNSAQILPKYGKFKIKDPSNIFRASNVTRKIEERMEGGLVEPKIKKKFNININPKNLQVTKTDESGAITGHNQADLGLRGSKEIEEYVERLRKEQKVLNFTPEQKVQKRKIQANQHNSVTGASQRSVSSVFSSSNQPKIRQKLIGFDSRGGSSHNIGYANKHLRTSPLQLKPNPRRHAKHQARGSELRISKNEQNPKNSKRGKNQSNLDQNLSSYASPGNNPSERDLSGVINPQNSANLARGSPGFINSLIKKYSRIERNGTPQSYIRRQRGANDTSMSSREVRKDGNRTSTNFMNKGILDRSARHGSSKRVKDTYRAVYEESKNSILSRLQKYNKNPKKIKNRSRSKSKLARMIERNSANLSVTGDRAGGQKGARMPGNGSDGNFFHRFKNGKNQPSPPYGLIAGAENSYKELSVVDRTSYDSFSRQTANISNMAKNLESALLSRSPALSKAKAMQRQSPVAEYGRKQSNGRQISGYGVMSRGAVLADKFINKYKQREEQARTQPGREELSSQIIEISLGGPDPLRTTNMINQQKQVNLVSSTGDSGLQGAHQNLYDHGKIAKFIQNQKSPPHTKIVYEATTREIPAYSPATSGHNVNLRTSYRKLNEQIALKIARQKKQQEASSGAFNPSVFTSPQPHHARGHLYNNPGSSIGFISPGNPNHQKRQNNVNPGHQGAQGGAYYVQQVQQHPVNLQNNLTSRQPIPPPAPQPPQFQTSTGLYNVLNYDPRDLRGTQHVPHPHQSLQNTLNGQFFARHPSGDLGHQQPQTFSLPNHRVNFNFADEVGAESALANTPERPKNGQIGFKSEPNFFANTVDSRGAGGAVQAKLEGMGHHNTAHLFHSGGNGFFGQYGSGQPGRATANLGGSVEAEALQGRLADARNTLGGASGGFLRDSLQEKVNFDLGKNFGNFVAAENMRAAGESTGPAEDHQMRQNQAQQGRRRNNVLKDPVKVLRKNSRKSRQGEFREPPGSSWKRKKNRNSANRISNFGIRPENDLSQNRGNSGQNGGKRRKKKAMRSSRRVQDSRSPAGGRNRRDWRITEDRNGSRGTGSKGLLSKGFRPSRSKRSRRDDESGINHILDF